MDLTQNKLTRAEWESLEVPVSANERTILDMISTGYNNPDVCINETQSLFSFIKIDISNDAELFLYKTYFESTISKIVNKYGKDTPLYEYIKTITTKSTANKHIKKSDIMRIKNLEDNINVNKPFIYEFLLIELFDKLLQNLYKNNKQYSFYLYTIIQLNKANIKNINNHVMNVINVIVVHMNEFVKSSEIISKAYDFIELNKFILKYEDKTLFSHQKQIFNMFKDDNHKIELNRKAHVRPMSLLEDEDEDEDNNGYCVDDNINIYPKLIMYTAPTGTGKTLTPIGLSEEYRIIFVCAARHIGMALAKSAISIGKKVAFAFGCDTSSDIRLHYFAAKDYTKNKRTGGIWKVDNGNGTKVEIIVCDAKSYLTAMHYMLAFNHKSKIISYLDEPTIALDCDDHPLHKIIHNNWKLNLIPNVILSCATLPEMDELQPIFGDFRNKFNNNINTSIIHSVTSYDCKKSIPILNKDGMCMLPHYMYENYTDLYRCVQYCMLNKTLLRYFDLREIIDFIKYINEEKLIDESYLIDNYYTSTISDITMYSLKDYYLLILSHIEHDNWTQIYQHMKGKRKYRFYGKRDVPSSGVLITTSDAYTLTDGPTIYLVEDAHKIGTFYIQQSKIDADIFNKLMQKISFNNDINDKIDKYERIISAKEDKLNDDESLSKKSYDNDKVSNETITILDEITKLQKKLHSVSLNPIYIPNTSFHQTKWTPKGIVHDNSFMSHIDDETSKTIMLLNVDDKLKILLLLGIGMFVDTPNMKYMEIMKRLADEQKLFIIIASTDYIYGTNYQFCHGFIGKDLTTITQQKTLQAMGRIGRNNVQQDYTIRFRDDKMIYALFAKPEVNIESNNMCRLFNCDDE